MFPGTSVQTLSGRIQGSNLETDMEIGAPAFTNKLVEILDNCCGLFFNVATHPDEK
jgi:hypothetical protein